MIAECLECGSRHFRRSKLNKYWYCKMCNEQYTDGKPLFPAITCSAHGKQPLHNAHGNWCWECDDEEWTFNWTNATEQQGNALPLPTPATHRMATSIKIDEDLWRAVKHHCTDTRMPIADYLEQLIRDELRK